MMTEISVMYGSEGVDPPTIVYLPWCRECVCNSHLYSTIWAKSCINNPYSAGIVFRRQNLTAKVDPRTVRENIFIMAVDP